MVNFMPVIFKSIGKVVAVLTLTLLIMNSAVFVVWADAFDIDIALRPYGQVMEELNNQIGSTYALPKDSEGKQTLYDNIKGFTPEQFKQRLIDQYPDVKDIDAELAEYNHNFWVDVKARMGEKEFQALLATMDEEMQTGILADLAYNKQPASTGKYESY